MGKTFSEMTSEELSAAGRKGGIQSGEAKRRKKTMRETFLVLLDMPMKSGKNADIESIKNFAALKGKNINIQQAMAIAQIQKALHGDTTAFTTIRDTLGEKNAKDETNEDIVASKLNEVFGDAVK